MAKQVLSKILVVVMLVSVFSAFPTFADSTESGTFGNDLTWVYDSSYTLTISGTGDMPDFTSSNTPPWYSLRSDIETVVIKSGITSVGNYAFYNCQYLENVSIPETVTIIGDHSFYNCRHIERLVIPEGVKSIVDSSFCGCNYLKTVALPSTVKSIAYCAFDDCTYLTDVYYSGDETAWGKIFIAAYNTYLKGSTIYYNSQSGYCGDSLNWILDNDGILSIDGKGAMKNYTSTRTPPWNDYKTSIKTVDISQGAATIGNWAFRNHKNLTKVFIPRSVESIGLGSFYGCTKLETVIYSGYESDWNNIEIGNNNEPLTNANIITNDPIETSGPWETDDPWVSGDPTNTYGPIETYDPYVSGEPAPTEQPICDKCGDNLSWIFTSSTGTLTISGTGAMYSFYDARPPWYPYRDSIKTVVIESGVTNVGAYAFSGYNYITSFSLANTVKTIDDWAFRGCNKLKSVTIPGTVTSIGSHAFASSYGITSVTIQNGVKTIESSAFYYDSKLEKVTIPVSVTTIDIGAFQMCNDISDVYYGGSKARWNKISIEYSNDPLLNATIHFAESSDDTVYGDITGDTNINIEDVVALVRYLGLKASGSEIDPAEFPLAYLEVAADVTGDSKINIDDIVLLVRYLGLKASGSELDPTEFPNGKFPAASK